MKKQTLTRLRVQRGYKSQLSIAEAAGLLPGRYNLIENGKTTYVPPDVAERIAEVLGSTVDALFMPTGFTAREIPEPNQEVTA